MCAAGPGALALAGAAWGQEPARSPAPADARPIRVVRVVVAASDSDADALTSSLSELLGRIGGRLVVQRAERVDTEDTPSLSVKSPDAFATAWIDMKSPQRAALVLVDGKSGRVVSRRSVPRASSADVTVEEVAHIVQASVEDMTVEEERAAPPPPETKPVPPPAASSAAPPPSSTASAAPSPPPVPARANERREPPAWGVDVGAFFTGAGFGSDSNVVVGGGGLADVRLGRGSLRPVIALSGAYFVPYDASGAFVRVRGNTLATRLAATLEWRATDRLLVSAGPDLGADVFWMRPEAVSVTNDRVGQSSTDASPMLGGLVGARLAFTRGADLFLLFATDVDLAPHRYVVKDGGGVGEVVFSPSRVRPSLSLGFSFSVAGNTYDPDPTTRGGQEPREARR
jgi:hypothetical protein